MKKEELRKIIDRVPTNESCNICGDRKYNGCFNLSFNGTSYDVFTVGDRGEISYYVKNVDEDTACEILFSHYKESIAISLKATCDYMKGSAPSEYLDQDSVVCNNVQLRLIRESEFLNVNTIREAFYSDGDVRVVYYGESYTPCNLRKVKIYNKETLIWEGGDLLFYENNKKSPTVSSAYNNVLLIQAGSDLHFKPMIVNLTTGVATFLSVASYGLYYFNNIGLLYSSNVVYYCKTYMPNTYTFLDIDKRVEIFQFPQIKKLLPTLYEWSVCPVPDCILILTLEPKNNLVLYNIRTQEIVQTATFPVEEDKYYEFVMVLDRDNNRVIVKSFCPTEPLGSDVQCYSVYFDDFLK